MRADGEDGPAVLADLGRGLVHAVRVEASAGRAGASVEAEAVLERVALEAAT
jgi:hypothetical protein